MNLRSRTQPNGGARLLRAAMLFMLFVGVASLFASAAAQDADARGSSSSSGSKSGVSSGSKSKAGSSSSSGVKHKAHKHKDFDCDEDDGCPVDEEAGSSDVGVVGWLVAIVVLGMVGVGVVGAGTVGYVGWRLYRGWLLRGDRPIR